MTRQIIMDTVEDIVTDFLRRRDDAGTIEQMVDEGKLTIEEIVEHFQIVLTTRIHDGFRRKSGA